MSRSPRLQLLRRAAVPAASEGLKPKLELLEVGSGSGVADFGEDGGDGVEVTGGCVEVGEGGLFDDGPGVDDEGVVLFGLVVGIMVGD